MFQPTLRMPHKPTAVMDPDDLDSVRETYRSDVTDTVHPFAGLGLHVDCCRKDRLIAAGLALLFAVYSRTARMRTVSGSHPRN